MGAPVLISFMKPSQKILPWLKAANCSVWAALNLFQVADKQYRGCIPVQCLAQLRGIRMAELGVKILPWQQHNCPKQRSQGSEGFSSPQHNSAPPFLSGTVEFWQALLSWHKLHEPQWPPKASFILQELEQFVFLENVSCVENIPQLSHGFCSCFIQLLVKCCWQRKLSL